MKKVLWWVGGVVLVIAALIVVDHTFIALNMGDSMSPTLKEGAVLLVTPFFTPQRGDIVIFSSEPGSVNSGFVKRIIGLPNDTVQIQDGEVLINGKVLDEPYVNGATEGSSTVTLGSDQFFLMGDNRPDSYDSRSFGAIPQRDILKKVITEL